MRMIHNVWKTRHSGKPTICSIENNTPTYSEKAVGVLSKLKSKLAAVGSTEIVIWTLVSTVVATGVGLGVKAVTTGENGVMSNIEERINNAPDKIMNGSGNSGAGGSGGGDLIPQTPSSPYGTLTKTLDISESQDGSVTMDYYDDTKTAVVSGSGTIGKYFPQGCFMGVDFSKMNDAEYQQEFMSTHNPSDTSTWDYPAETLIIENSVTNIDSCAFYNCTSLTSIEIQNGVTTIGDNAFNTCTSLTSVTIPNSVTTIGLYAFESCTSLTSIEIPNSVTTIDFSTFINCTSLTSVTIPNSVTSIGMDAFSGCNSLTSITIPNSVTTIGNGAFSGCTSLTDVYYSGTEEKWNTITIENYNTAITNATIHYNS